MIKFQKITGVSLQDSSLPKITISPEGQAMGAVPGWACMFDPEYITIPSSPEENSALNRSSGRFVLTGRGSSSSPEKVEEDGLPFIRAYGQDFLNMLGDRDVDPERWTVFAVIKNDPEDVTGSGRARNFIVLSEPGDTADGISLSVSYSNQTGNFIVYEYDDDVPNMPQRISVEAGLLDNELALVMATFSVENGIKAYVNGQLAGEEPDDKRPLTHGYNADQYRFFRLFRGQYGMAGILSADLGSPENEGHRRAIEKFLMNKYSISA